jgi:hypothetical protein
MKYTSKKPKKEGYYWFRYYRGDTPYEYTVRVYFQSDTWWVDEGEYSTELSEMDGEFAGPIEKPEN